LLHASRPHDPHAHIAGGSVPGGPDATSRQTLSPGRWRTTDSGPALHPPPPASLANCSVLTRTDEIPLPRPIPHLHGGSLCRLGPAVDLGTRTRLGTSTRRCLDFSLCRPGHAVEYSRRRVEQGDQRCSSSPEEVHGGRAPLPMPPSPGHALPPPPMNSKSPYDSRRWSTAGAHGRIGL
jgi:hypothetical protein